MHVQHQASLVVVAERGEGQFLERGVGAVFWPFFSLGGLGRAGGPGARTERRGSARNPDLLRHAGVPVLPSGAPSGSLSSRLPPGGPRPSWRARDDFDPPPALEDPPPPRGLTSVLARARAPFPPPACECAALPPRPLPIVSRRRRKPPNAAPPPISVYCYPPSLASV